MLSVTKRIETVCQPYGGYIPKSSFVAKTYTDSKEVAEIRPDLSGIQGMTVDYLTRFILCGNKIESFNISLKGAQKLDEKMGGDEYNKACKLLEEIKGLDRISIVNACKIVCYDSAFRAGILSYVPEERIEWDEALFSNIAILVNRSITFIKSEGTVVLDGFSFEGGFTKLVSSGDGDFLLKNHLENMIVDIKVSKKEFSSEWSLQLLMYYLLGIHSIHKEFQDVTKLCIYNPYLNKSFICQIADISDESKYKVSRNIIGYKMIRTCKEDSLILNKKMCYSTWDAIQTDNGNAVTDDEILFLFLDNHTRKTCFDVTAYGNGIFDITNDDYWTYLSTTFYEYNCKLRPKFSYIDYVKLIKNNGYYMFVSVSSQGKYSLLHGGRRHSLKRPLEYYYNNIEKYSVAVISCFREYWDALRIISEQLKSINPSGLLSGNIHGCIVDIDWFNHIYINPYDGTVTPYHATSMFDKDVYINVKSLLSTNRPDLLSSFNQLIEANNTDKTISLLNQKDNLCANNWLSKQDDTISESFAKVYEYDMYAISNWLKPLQCIYDNNLVKIWYENFLDEASLPHVVFSETLEKKLGLKI